MKSTKKNTPIPTVHVNRKAKFDYEVLREFEAGIILLGHEVKSVRDGMCNLRGSYISTRGRSAYIVGLHISPYRHMGNRLGVDPKRERKILLHASDIAALDSKTREKGVTLVPMSLYWKGNLAKVRVALVRGRKLHDKRRVLKERDMEREVQREIRKERM